MRGTPNLVPSVVFYQVGQEIVRFLRVEFALVTGLKFGGSSLDLYASHQIPASSFYTRTLIKSQSFHMHYGEDSWTKILSLSLTTFWWQVSSLEQSISCWIGPEQFKNWLWVLIKNRKYWVEFPWGNMSFQIMLRALTHVRTQLNKEGVKEVYHFMGNTIAFLSWIYSLFLMLGVTSVRSCKLMLSLVA